MTPPKMFWPIASKIFIQLKGDLPYILPKIMHLFLRMSGFLRIRGPHSSVFSLWFTEAENSPLLKKMGNQVNSNAQDLMVLRLVFLRSSLWSKSPSTLPWIWRICQSRANSMRHNSQSPKGIYNWNILREKLLDINIFDIYLTNI